VRLEGLGQLKIPMGSLGIEPATFRHVIVQAPVQAENHPQAEPTFVGTAPVYILGPLPKHRKETAAILTNRGHFNQGEMFRQKATGVGQKSRRANALNTAKEKN
jgi:hypothetical protein